MKDKFLFIVRFLIAVVLVGGYFITGIMISWLIVCGLAWVVTSILGYQFDVTLSTAVWIVIMLLVSMSRCEK